MKNMFLKFLTLLVTSSSLLFSACAETTNTCGGQAYVTRTVVVDPPSSPPPPKVIMRYICGACRMEFRPSAEFPYCPVCVPRERVQYIAPPVFYQAPVVAQPQFIQPALVERPLLQNLPTFPTGGSYNYNRSFSESFSYWSR